METGFGHAPRAAAVVAALAFVLAAETAVAGDARARLAAGGPARLSAGVQSHPGAGRPHSFRGPYRHHYHPRHGLDPVLGLLILTPLIWHSFHYPHSHYYAPRAWTPPAPTQYIERPDDPPASARPSGYWYYCAEANGYYPTVAQCPGAWQLVAPRPATE